MMKTIAEILQLSIEYLKQRNISNPRRQAEDLLADALGMKRLQLYMQYERPLDNSELDLCRTALLRRAQGEPVQYIHGKMEFYDCQFKVNRAVLIPRHETEILVDKIVQIIADQDLTEKVLWDLCTGSGCIGISIKKAYPQLNVHLSDISTEALAVAKENASENEVHVSIHQGDLLLPFEGKKAHFIVCNPPYISENEWDKLDVEVRNYEPRQALIAGPSGLEYYERLAAQLPNYLYPHAKVWMEMGAGQGNQIKDLFKNPCWVKKQVEKDWAGHDRFFSLEIE